MYTQFFCNDRFKVLQCMAMNQAKWKDVPMSKRDIMGSVQFGTNKVGRIMNELKSEGYIMQQDIARGQFLLTSKGKKLIRQFTQNEKEISIFSFFSGSGFLDLGFEKAGYMIELVNEYSPSFLKAYQYAREKMDMREPKYGYFNEDINIFLSERKDELKEYIRKEKMGNKMVGFIGGPPCPDFSVGGKNRGKDGENGKLSSAYIDLIIEMKPDFFLFENVKGLWRTARHREFFEELKEKLHIAGYLTTERLTNALEFGVPQDRERILLFGIRSQVLGDKRKCQVFDAEFPWVSYSQYSLEQIKAIHWPDMDDFHENGKISLPKDIIEELTVEYWFDKNKVNEHPNANSFFIPRDGLSKMKAIKEGDASRKSYKRLHRWRYSPTAAYGNNEVHLHPYKIRRISVSEALAIQSLPREFELPKDMSLSDMFKTVGNGVPYLLAFGVAKSIQDYLYINGILDV